MKGIIVISDVSNVSHAKINRSSLWHKRHAHINEKGLQELYKQKLLSGDKIEGLDSVNIVFWEG